MRKLLALALLAVPLPAQTPAAVSSAISSAQTSLVNALAALNAIPACPAPSSGGSILNWFPVNPPDFSVFSWVNQNTASYSVSALGLPVLAVPYQATAQFNNLVQSLPSPPYTATITFAMTTPNPGSYTTGLTLQAGSRAVNFMANLYTATGSLVVSHETVAGYPISGTTETVVYQNSNAPDAQIRSLRIQDNGTTRTFLYSADGGTAFVPLYSEPSGTFLQPTSFGVVVFNKANVGVTVYSTIYNLGVTVP